MQINRDNIKIEIMQESDLEHFENNLIEFDDFWSFKLLKEEFENEFTTCVVAKIGNEIVGFASLWEPPFEIHVNNIFVRKDMRGNKIGSIILERLIDIAKEKQKEELTLEVNINNTTAIKLYENYGFEKISIRKKYYNNVDDGVIMTKKLI